MMIIQISFSNERNEGLSVPRKTNLCTFSAEWFSSIKKSLKKNDLAKKAIQLYGSWKIDGKNIEEIIDECTIKS